MSALQFRQPLSRGQINFSYTNHIFKAPIFIGKPGVGGSHGIHRPYNDPLLGNGVFFAMKSATFFDLGFDYYTFDLPDSIDDADDLSNRLRLIEYYDGPIQLSAHESDYEIESTLDAFAYAENLGIVYACGFSISHQKWVQLTGYQYPNHTAIGRVWSLADLDYVRQVVGQNDPLMPMKVSVFPNPTNRTLHLTTQQPIVGHYTIMTTAGQNLHSGNLQGQVIDVEKLPSGFYLLRIVTDENRTTMIRFVKN